MAAVLALSGTARAQEGVFVATVRELAAAALTAGASGPYGRLAAERLKTALDGWDRELRSLEARLQGAAANAAGGGEFQRRVELGLAYGRRGRLDAAMKQFDAAAALQPGASDVHLLRALTLEAAGRPAEAARAFHTAWQRDAGNPVKAYLTLRRTPDMAAPDRERARATMRDASRRLLSADARPSSPPFLVLDPIPDGLVRAPALGDATTAALFEALASGRFDDAVATPADARPRAEGGLTPVQGSDPRTRDRQSPRALAARARAAETEGRLADARRDYAAALAGTLAGRHVIHVGIGRIAQVEGDLDAALASFAEAVRLHPNDPLIHRELAAAFAAADRPGDAFVELVAALLVDPRDAEALAAIGQLHVDADRPRDAIPVLRRALQVQPDRFQTHYALGVALSRAGLADEAAREFARFEERSRQSLAERRRAVAGHAGPGEPAR